MKRFRLSILFLALILAMPVSAQPPPQVNINTASVEELRALPGIGPALAERIVAHRGKHGLFKRPQDVIIVRGMSAKRYRRIADRIRI